MKVEIEKVILPNFTMKFGRFVYRGKKTAVFKLRNLTFFKLNVSRRSDIVFKLCTSWVCIFWSNMYVCS